MEFANKLKYLLKKKMTKLKRVRDFEISYFFKQIQ